MTAVMDDRTFNGRDRERAKRQSLSWRSRSLAFVGMAESIVVVVVVVVVGYQSHAGRVGGGSRYFLGGGEGREGKEGGNPLRSLSQFPTFLLIFVSSAMGALSSSSSSDSLPYWRMRYREGSWVIVIEK
jgi:hypothetical protein